jgi:YVTN family beta-propeller protein
VVEYHVLGPLEALGPFGPVTLGGGRPRVLLAVLVMRAGEFVSRSELIDALWPEAPPASASQSLESYVSRLRTALRASGASSETLVSVPGGYRLVRDGNRFDHELFIALSDRARTALTEGDAEGASNIARQALALWRGPALAGIAEERAVRADAIELEDRRLGAIETRAEAGLAAGRDADVVAELRAGASRNPRRERIHELLIVALYRAGRQTEALEVYRDIRNHLTSELGLEPGPELRELQARILKHDPSLVARKDEVGAAIAPTLTRRRSARRALFLGVTLLLAVAAVAGIVRGAQNAGVSALDGRLQVPAIGELAIPSGRPQSAAGLSAIPSDIIAGAAADWATSYDDGTLTRIDPATAAVVQTILVGHGPAGIAIDAGDAWVADSLDDSVARVSITTDQVVQRIAVGEDPVGVAAGAGAIWVASAGSGTVTRIDPLTGTVLTTTQIGPSPVAVAVGDGGVWVAVQGSDAVAQLDAQTGRVVQTISVGSGPSAIAIGSSGVWVANELDSTVSLVDPVSDAVVLTRAVTGSPSALAATGRDVWIAGDEPDLTLLTPSGQARAIAIPSPATALAPGSRGLLVGVRGIGADHRGGTLIARLEGPIAQIDPSSCCDLPPNVRALAYDSLLSFSKSTASPDTLVPDLALAIPLPRDRGLVYTFRLRPGLRYSTGARVRASDFVRGIETAAMSSGVEASYIGALPGALACPGAQRCNLARAVIADDRAGTVTLHLSHPDPETLLALGLPYFAPKPPGGEIRPATGPYRIVRYVPGVLIDFERNRFFREWAPAAQPAGYPDRILVYSNGTATADIDAVLAGRADYTFDQPTRSQLHTIIIQHPGLLHTEPLPDTDWLGLDTRQPPFSNLLARRALNYAVDRRAIVNLYGGPEDATPTCQIIPATIEGHQPYCPYTRDPSASGRWIGPNLARARQMIAASGTQGDSVKVLTEAASGPSSEPVGAYTVALLRQLGYRAHLRVVTTTQWAAALNSYRDPPQIATNSWIADYPSSSDWITLKLTCGEWDPPTLFNNDSEFCDPTADRLATRAAELQVTNPSTADRLSARVDRLITNLAPWVPTVTETETDLVSQHVGDYQYVPTMGALLDQLWLH